VLDAQSYRVECLHQLVSGLSSVAATISNEVERNLWFLILETSQLHADRWFNNSTHLMALFGPSMTKMLYSRCLTDITLFAIGIKSRSTLSVVQRYVLQLVLALVMSLVIKLAKLRWCCFSVILEGSCSILHDSMLKASQMI
jgi:hypothetical protein